MNALKTKETISRPRSGTTNAVDSDKVMPETDNFTDRFRKAFIRKAKNDVTRYVIDQYFDGLQSGAELETIVTLFSEDVDFYIPGRTERVPWMGPRSGRAGVVDFISQLREEVASVDFNVRSILVDGAESVALGVQESRVRNTEEVIESEFAINFTVHNARITRFRLFEDSLAIAQAAVTEKDFWFQ